MKLSNWRICIQDRNKWKRIVERPSLSIYEVVTPDEELPCKNYEQNSSTVFNNNISSLTARTHHLLDSVSHAVI
jgi:hypothetical protein